jgi:hypothetical protein
MSSLIQAVHNSTKTLINTIKTGHFMPVRKPATTVKCIGRINGLLRVDFLAEPVD